LREGLAGAAQPPALVVERVRYRIDARGESRSDRAWAAAVECTVRQSRSGWVPLPLDLRGLLLDRPPEHEGPGRMVVDADAEGATRCWFELPADAAADAEHTVRFFGRVAVDVSAAQDVLQVAMPSAAATRLELQTARPAPAVSLAPEGSGHIEVTPDEDGGLVVITGLAGDVRLRVTDATDHGGPAAAAQVEGESVVRVTGRTATVAARLKLAGLPPGSSRMRLSLPPGMMVRSVGAAATRGTDATSAADPAVVDLVVTAAADGRAVIAIECEGPVDPSGRTPLQPLGFAVAGIEPWRQWGRAILIVDGDLQATWDEAAGLRRVDPPAGEREPGFVAAFVYDAQPAALAVRLRPRRSRVVIEPEYRYDVSAGRIAIDGRLRVAARGAAVGGLVVALEPAWSLEDVGPAGLVDAAAVRVEEGLVTIPFLQPLAGDAVVEFRASRSIDSEAAAVAWEFPIPRADMVGPAAVVITADADIELAPDPEASRGLVRQTASSITQADPDRIPLVYRLDTPAGRFVAARRFLPRRVEASVATRVAVDDQQAEVEETIRLEVMHVPLEFVELTVPEAAINSGSFEIRQGPELLDPVELNRVVDEDAAEVPLIRLRALLPVPLLGEGEVVVRYAIPVPPVPREATLAFDLPLALPTAAGLGRQTLVLADASGLTVGVRGDAWRRDLAGRAAGQRTWSAAKPQQQLPLSLTERVRETSAGTIVETAWLQTRLHPQTREDIATLLVSGAAGPLTIDFTAAEFSPAACDVRLDGEPVATEWQGRGRLVIDLDAGGEDASPLVRLLEIRTTAPWGGTAAGLGLPWPLRLAPPAFAEVVLQRRFAWEVITAVDDHLLAAPVRWTNQQQWVWQGLGWREEAILTQPSLAESVRRGLPAAAADRPLLALDSRPGGRRSVFTGVGPPGSATLWVVPTWALVLAASGPLLAYGLGSLTRPAWRAPAAVIGFAAVAVLAAAAAPDLAILVAQAAAPGGLLAVLAAGLHWAATRRPAAAPLAGAAAASSSLTRTAAPTVSLVVASSAASAHGREQR
ncbi:MAG: hypothetical protein RLZZ440_2599, partial [Planctomycetota bacterium]